MRITLDTTYKYAVNAEVKAANYYYNQLISENSPFLTIDREKLIAHVKNNPYIYFDYIENKYKVFHLKYIEELRLSNNSKWKEKLFWHCEIYNIPIINFCDREKWRGVLIDLATKEAHFVGKHYQQTLKNILETAYGITYKQPEKISEELKSQNAPIRIINEQGTKKAERGKTYWQVVFAEDYKNA